MLFNAPSDRGIIPGYSILKDAAGDTITLSCRRLDDLVRPLFRCSQARNTIAPDIIMDSTPTIYLAPGSQLTITGDLLQSGTVGLNVSGGGVLSLSSAASNYTGPLSVQSSVVNTSYLTPAGFTLTDSWLDYSGPGTATLSQPLVAREVRRGSAASKPAPCWPFR